MNDTLFKENNKIYRQVENIEQIEKIINIFTQNNLFSEQIVETMIVDRNKKILEHKFLSPIIHSGEFTTSMALDLTKHSIDLSLKLIDLGIYSYDLVPHQYTYIDGKWILFDFDSFHLTPNYLKSGIRQIFKISFSSFELLKYIERKKLKDCFLNRISHHYLSQMIPLIDYFKWSINLEHCLLLNNLKFHKAAIIQLKKFFDNYAQNIERKTYKNVTTDNEKELYKLVDEILTNENINSTFSIGEKAAKWSINSKSNSSKFVYLDDYDICDGFYNYIHQNKYKNITTAVIYPFMKDNEIPKDFSYRAIYDYYAQERYNAQSVLILNSDELLSKQNFNIKTFCENIVEFSTYFYLHKFDKHTEKELANTFRNEMNKYYQNTNFVETNDNIILIAKNKKQPQKDFSNLKQYENSNRGPLSKEQNIEIIKLIKANKIK